jgi:hypothetical protein
VVSSGPTYFRESFSFENAEKKRARHGSGFSDVSVSSDERGKIGDSERIQEEE